MSHISFNTIFERFGVEVGKMGKSAKNCYQQKHLGDWTLAVS